VWDIRLLEDHGIERYPYGPAGLIDLHCASRRSEKDEPAIIARSNVPVELVVRWAGGSKTLPLEVE
jgi:hypothetical protein